MSRGFKDLRFYQLAYQLAMRVFQESKRFPGEERKAFIDGSNPAIVSQRYCQHRRRVSQAPVSERLCQQDGGR